MCGGPLARRAFQCNMAEPIFATAQRNQLQ
jgi:hypothetical protein